MWGCGGGAGGGGGGARSWPCGAEEEEEDLFVFNDTIEGPRAAQRSGWRWPPSPCRGVAPCGLRLVTGVGGWCCCCGAVTHAVRSVGACNWGPPSLASSLTVTGCRLGGFPVRRDRWGGERVVGGVLPLAHGVCVLVYV